METTQGAATETAPTQTPELEPAAAAPPADGGVVSEDTSQPVETSPTPAPATATPHPGQDRQTQSERPSRNDRRNAELSRQNRELRERLARLEGRFEERTPQNAAPAAVENPAPNPKDSEKYPGGQFDPQFLEDKAAWIAEQRVEAKFRDREERETAAKREAEEQREYREGQARFFAAREAAEENDLHDATDLFERLNKAGRRDLIDDIADADNPAWLAQWLALNVDTARDIFAMPARRRARVLGNLDDQISRNLKKTPAPVSASAAPSTPAPKPPPNPTPTPTPTANGRAAGNGADDGGSGYDALFKH